MDGGPSSGLSQASSVVLELSSHRFLICVKIWILIFFFPRCLICYVTASVGVPRVGLTTFPGLVQEVPRA